MRRFPIWLLAGMVVLNCTLAAKQTNAQVDFEPDDQPQAGAPGGQPR